MKKYLENPNEYFSNCLYRYLILSETRESARFLAAHARKSHDGLVARRIYQPRAAFSSRHREIGLAPCQYLTRDLRRALSSAEEQRERQR